MQVTYNNVNRALAEAGYPGVELAKGNGYFYFYGTNNEMALKISSFYTSAVYVFHLSSLSVYQWVAQFAEKLRDYEKNRITTDPTDL